MKRNGNRFAVGIFFLTAANLLVKVLGLIFKIPLVSLLGDDGMGYFNSAYTVYSFFYILTTAGIPSAMSLLVSEQIAIGNPYGARQLRKKTLLAFSLFGGIIFSVVYFGAPVISNMIGNPGSAPCIRAISPSLMICSLSGVYRGSFQGEKSMAPTALSQVVEALFKLGLGLWFGRLALLKTSSVPAVAARVTFAITLSELVSLLLLIAWRKWRDRKCRLPDEKRIPVPFRQLLSIAVPITITSCVMSLTNMIDLITVMRRLQAAGYSDFEANRLYGNYTGLAVPLFNLPPVLIYPIASAILPYISSCLAKGKLDSARQYVSRSLSYAFLLGLPCAVGLSAFSSPILCLLFPKESAELAAPLLRLLAPSCLFVGLLAASSSCLQSFGHTKAPILSMLMGAALKIVFEGIAIPRIKMNAVPLGTLICYMVAATVNLVFLSRVCAYRPSLVRIIKVSVSSAMCAAAAAIVLYLLPASGYAILPAILSGVIVYFICLIILGGADRSYLPIHHIKYKDRTNDNRRIQKQRPI